MIDKRRARRLAPRAALAQSKTVVKIGWTTSDGAQDPYAVGAREFKRAVEAGSNGRIEVQLFPNRAIGDEKPMLEGMRLGTVEAGAAATRAQRQAAGAAAKEVVARLEAKGMKINRVPDFKPFRAAVEPVCENFKGSIDAGLLTEALAAVQ